MNTTSTSQKTTANDEWAVIFFTVLGLAFAAVLFMTANMHGYNNGYKAGQKAVWVQAINLDVAEAVADVKNNRIDYRFKGVK